MILYLLESLRWIVRLEFVHLDDVIELVVKRGLQALIIQATGRRSSRLLLLLRVSSLRLLPRLSLGLIALLGSWLRVAGWLIA